MPPIHAAPYDASDCRCARYNRPRPYSAAYRPRSSCKRFRRKHGPSTSSEPAPRKQGANGVGFAPLDRKSVVSGKSVSVRVDLGGRRIIKKKNKQKSKRTEAC